MKDLKGLTCQNTETKQMVDLTHIKTPEELLAFLSGLQTPKRDSTPPCQCGMTEELFESEGRFGCANCYTHFKHQMETVVLPFHKTDQHVGKRPKRYIEHLMEDPIEKEKILKLRLAKAIELEEYEKAAEIKKEISSLVELPLSEILGQ